eukprot:TRINITY_DN273_c0_g1_i2.p1 TRINITY_DN273_c0_g1~~TRINITY_DN273_c0_g1_i2.p1  ORF type:complete len:665 (-),score=105.41 TRINITY_DN273_c0_g1_i2:188-2182(-)
MTDEEGGPSSVSTTPRKIALIIGQNNYEFLPELCLSHKDAELMEKTSQKLGFNTVKKTDLTHEQLHTELKGLRQASKDNDIILFYFSGHAAQQNSTNGHYADNFLFGIDAQQTKDEEDENVKYVTRGIPLQYDIIQLYFTKKCIYLIVLDACRTYPQNSEQIRSKGLQPPPDPPMTLMVPALPNLPIEGREFDFVFACQPGKKAYEKSSKESGYLSAALSTTLGRPGSWVEAAHATIDHVIKASKQEQQPSIYLNVREKLQIVPKMNDNCKSLTFDRAPSSLEQILEPNSKILEEVLQMPQQILEPELNDEKLEETTINRFKNFIENYGSLVDQILEISNNQVSDFEVAPKSSIDEIFIRRVKISVTQSSHTKNFCPEVLNIKLNSGQKVYIENCIFERIGLKIEYKNTQNKQSAKNIQNVQNHATSSFSGSQQSSLNQLCFSPEQSQDTGELEITREELIKHATQCARENKSLQTAIAEWGLFTQKQHSIMVRAYEDETSRMSSGVFEKSVFSNSSFDGNVNSDSRDAGTSNLLSSNHVQIDRIKVLNAPKFGLALKNLRSVGITNTSTQNCNQVGIRIHKINNLKIKQTNIAKSGESGLHIQDCENFCVKNVDVENCKESAFEFLKSDGRIQNCRYRNCDDGIVQYAGCTIDQENVQELKKY